MLITEEIAIARVKFRSLLGERRKILPKPGRTSSQLERIIKIKIVAMRGKNFLAFSLFSRTFSIKLRIFSIKTSKKFCHLRGTSLSRLESALEKNNNVKTIIREMIKVLVISRFWKFKSFSGDKWISIMSIKNYRASVI